MFDRDNHYVAYVFLLQVLISRTKIIKNPDLKYLRWLELVIKKIHRPLLQLGKCPLNVQEDVSPNCSVFSITTVLYHYVPCPYLQTYSIVLRRHNKFRGIKGFRKGFGLRKCTVGPRKREYVTFHMKS